MSPIVSKRSLEDLRHKCDIAEVIGAAMTLKRAGTSLKGLCPFHKEKTPSFSVNPQRQIFHCFGCGAGGDVFKFLMDFEGVDFVTAVRMLADRCGAKLEYEDGEPSPTGGRDHLFRILSEVADSFHRCLIEKSNAVEARSYLKERDLASETAEAFLIGFAPDKWDSMLTWGRHKGYSPEQLEEAGLVIRSDKPNPRNPFYDRFRNRLMFPIHDEQARIVGFSGRVLSASDTSAKYVNSPETPVFHKSRLLYGLDKARRHIVQERRATLCEGQIDVIRCHQAGLTHAVCAQGTAFTEQHARILKRYADSVVIVFDSDKAGRDAAIRAAAVLIDAGLVAKIAELPNGEDPDSFIRTQGVAAFQAALDNSRSTVDFQINVLSEEHDPRSEIGIMRITREVLMTIARTPNAVQQAKLIQQCAQRLNVPIEALQTELRRIRLPAPRREMEQPETRPDHPAAELELARHLCQCLDNPETIDLVRQYLPLSMLQDTVCRVLVEIAIEARDSGRPFHDIVADHNEPSGELSRLAAAVQEGPTKTGGEYSHHDAVRDLILFIHRRELKRERLDLDERMRGDSNPDEELRVRSAQLRRDLKTLQQWDTALPLLEMHGEPAAPSGPSGA
jgi:DNA primase